MTAESANGEFELVGPVLRSGELADAVIAAIQEDNPGKEVSVIDRGDYVRIHTRKHCRLSRETLEKHLGQPFRLSLLEVEMPSFAGRLRTRDDEIVWYYET